MEQYNLYRSFRMNWRIFKIQIWSLFLLHKLILIICKYALFL